MKLQGKVKLKTFGEGSKSEHEAVYLETEDGDEYVLRKAGSNPFESNDLKRFNGKEVEATGILREYIFFVKVISELK